MCDEGIWKFKSSGFQSFKVSWMSQSVRDRGIGACPVEDSESMTSLAGHCAGRSAWSADRVVSSANWLMIIQGGPNKVSHYQSSSSNDIKNGRWGYNFHQVRM